MSETTIVPNFNGLEGYKTVVYDTEVIPDEILRQAQSVQRESLLALIPAEEQARADFLVKWEDFEAYKKSRVNPQTLVGREWNSNQIFRRPKFAATFDRSDQLVGGVFTADNSSAKLPQPLGFFESRAKMFVKPGVNVPMIGNKRYVHLRETFTHPDAQESLDLPEGSIEVGGIALAGTYFSLDKYDPNQLVVAYEIPGDKADTELTVLTAAVGMQNAKYNRSHQLPGFTEKLVRVSGSVEAIVDEIFEMPGAETALLEFRYSRQTK